MWVKNVNCEFEIDDKFAYLIGMCSFHLTYDGYIETCVNMANFHVFSKLGYKIRQSVLLHRILFELHIDRKLNNKELIDHKDMCRTNNKLENLRVLSQSENLKNRKLRTGQIFYNIYHDKNNNYFKFQHKENRIQRNFRTLHEALAFFLEYDKANDYVLTKHIYNPEPIDGIENIILAPDPEAKCGICNSEFWSKKTLKRHQKNYHS